MSERCDAAMTSRNNPDWPCLLVAGHRGAHLYDTGVKARAEVKRLREYDPCQGAYEQYTRHLDVCVPWYEYRGGDDA